RYRRRPVSAHWDRRPRRHRRPVTRAMSRWRWRGSVALLAVCLAFFIYPLLPNDDVINSDWPAFATGARLIVSDPGHLYDLEVQKRIESDVTGGRTLTTPGIEGILPFLAPAWVALLAAPFEAFGTDVGGRLWILFGLACLGAGLYLATRPRPPARILPAFAAVPTALMMLNAQLDGVVALGIGAAVALWKRPYLAGLALGLTLMKPQLMLPLGAAVLYLARRMRAEKMRPAVAILVAGGVLAAPHALPADLVLVALALVLWGRAEWFDWLALSLAALVAALTIAPLPAVIGVVLVGYVLARVSGFISPSPAPAAAS